MEIELEEIEKATKIAERIMRGLKREVEKWVKRALRFKEQMDKLGVKCKVTVEVKERRRPCNLLQTS